MAAKKAVSKKASGKKVARKKPATKKAPKPAPSRVIVENVNVPGYRTSVDAKKYNAMKSTLLAALPRGPPGLTQTEMMVAARANAPRTEFPGGNKAEWWAKSVQLDLEAKGKMKRSDTRPLRWWRV